MKNPVKPKQPLPAERVKPSKLSSHNVATSEDFDREHMGMSAKE
jgi:hypothetical protein